MDFGTGFIHTSKSQHPVLQSSKVTNLRRSVIVEPRGTIEEAPPTRLCPHMREDEISVRGKFRERTEESTFHVELGEKASGSLVQLILCRKLRMRSLYS